MEDLFNLDISSVEIVNESKDKVSRASRLNEYIERFSELIKQHSDCSDGSDVYEDLLLVFKAIKLHGSYLQDNSLDVFVIKLDNGWYKVKKDDPEHRHKGSPWERYILEELVPGIITTADRLELNDLIEAYRKKCKADSISRYFSDVEGTGNTENV